jgi:hypothetical protein
MKTYLYILSIFLVFLSACTERMDFDLNTGENNRLVVDGGITNVSEIQTIKLTRSTDFLINEEAPAELGATVYVAGGGDVFYFYDADNDGVYETETEVAGTPGNNYTLHIELENKEYYTAHCFMDPIESIDSLQYEYVEEFIPTEDGPPELEYVYKIYLFADEPETPGDHYMWDLFIDNELDSDTLREKVFTDDLTVNGNYISYFDVFWIADEDITEDITEITVQMMSITKEQYEHHLALMLETDWKGGPFEGPPANVPTNISNGALGFFYANAISSYTIEVYYQSNPWEL